MAQVPYGLVTGSHATASPSASGNGSVITKPDGVHGFFLSVATQACYLTLDGTAPTATNGLTFPAGWAGFIPVGKNVTVLSATAGSVVNICWLQ